MSKSSTYHVPVIGHELRDSRARVHQRFVPASAIDQPRIRTTTIRLKKHSTPSSRIPEILAGTLAAKVVRDGNLVHLGTNQKRLEVDAQLWA